MMRVAAINQRHERPASSSTLGMLFLLEQSREAFAGALGKPRTAAVPASDQTCHGFGGRLAVSWVPLARSVSSASRTTSDLVRPV